MKTIEEIRSILNAQKQVLYERYGVRKIAVFGSYARGESTPTSDLDLLVDLEKPLGLKFFELWDYLEQVLGMRVDLATPNALRRKPLLWESVKDELVYV